VRTQLVDSLLADLLQDARFLWVESTRSEFTQSCDEWKRGFVDQGNTSHFNILQEWAIHCEINRDAGTIKRQRGQTHTKGHLDL
jgi:hypothetical protein